MKAKDYRIKLHAIQAKMLEDIIEIVKQHGPFTWDGEKDEIFGPLVMFEDGDGTCDTLDVQHMFVDELDDVILMGYGRGHKFYDNVYLDDATLDSLPSILARIE